MGKKAKKGKDEEDGENKEDPDAWVKPEFPEEPELWITLQCFLKDWQFMDPGSKFGDSNVMRVKCTTKIFQIKQRLAANHELDRRAARDLVICKNVFDAKNELKDEMKTLEEYGVMGSPDDEDKRMHKVLKLYYEFAGASLRNHDDPLLLSEPSEELKAEDKQKAEKQNASPARPHSRGRDGSGCPCTALEVVPVSRKLESLSPEKRMGPRSWESD